MSAGVPIPGFVATLHAFLKHRALVSLRAELELTPNLTLGRGVVIGSFTRVLSRDGPLRIGARTEIAAGCTIAAPADGAVIGEDCLIGPGVCILGEDEARAGLAAASTGARPAAPGIRIADNVWIGANCTILEGADIGPGAIVAPGSVVASELPGNAIAQGVPAKVVFTRR